MSKQIAVRLPDDLARLDEPRPVLVLTRDLVRPHLATVTVAPITTTIRGLSTEVPVDAASCDNLATIPADALGQRIGGLLERQEPALGGAIRAAFDLD